MLEEKFIEISEILKCDYKKENTKHSTGVSGNFLSVTVLYLKVIHHNSIINIKCEFGGQNIAEFNSEIKFKELKENFEISTQSHFKRLFVKNKSPWKIKSLNSVFKEKLLRLLEISELSEIAKETTFEPIIKGVLVENQYKLTTQFSLAFKDKEEAILPMINLYKALIDLLSV